MRALRIRFVLVVFVVGAATGCASHDATSPAPTPSEASTAEPTPVASTGRVGMTLPTSTASAASPEPAPSFEVWTTCSSDPDCVLSDIDPETCCPTCTTKALTRAQEESQAARCSGDAARSCPDMDCKAPRNMARCVDHACVVAGVPLPRS